MQLLYLILKIMSTYITKKISDMINLYKIITGFYINLPLLTYYFYLFLLVSF